MWNLHRIVDSQDSKEFYYFVDAFSNLIKNLDSSKAMKILNIFYKKNKKENGLIVANKLLWGLRKNNFFEFEKFVRDIRGR